MTQEDISDYVAANMKDPISRLNGVGDVQLFGAQYAMRIWMDATELTKYQLTPVDVINAIKAQNDQIAAGQLGGTPAGKSQQLNASIIAQTRLKDRKSLAKSCCASIRTALRSISKMSRVLSLAVKTITSSRALTVNQRLRSRHQTGDRR